jgi:hypothetical protein
LREHDDKAAPVIIDVTDEDSPVLKGTPSIDRIGTKKLVQSRSLA